MGSYDVTKWGRIQKIRYRPNADPWGTPHCKSLLCDVDPSTLTTKFNDKYPTHEIRRLDKYPTNTQGGRGHASIGNACYASCKLTKAWNVNSLKKEGSQMVVSSENKYGSTVYFDAREVWFGTTKKKLHHNHTLFSHFIIFTFIVWPPNNVSKEMFSHNRAVVDVPSTLSPHSLTFETDWQKPLLDVGEQM